MVLFTFTLFFRWIHYNTYLIRSREFEHYKVQLKHSQFNVDINRRCIDLHAQGTANLAVSECAPTSKHHSCVVSRPINVFKNLDWFLVKYVHSKTRPICYEWTALVCVCYVVRLTLNNNIYHRVLPKGRSFTANSGIKAAVLPKGRFSTANSGTKVAVQLGMNRCGSFLLLSAPHSLFSI